MFEVLECTTIDFGLYERSKGGWIYALLGVGTELAHKYPRQ